MEVFRFELEGFCKGCFLPAIEPSLATLSNIITYQRPLEGVAKRQHFLYSISAMTHCLVKYREVRELSQDALGALLDNVPGNTVARWERGECIPQRKHREKIRDICGIPIAKIISDCVAAAEQREAAE